MLLQTRGWHSALEFKVSPRLNSSLLVCRARLTSLQRITSMSAQLKLSCLGVLHNLSAMEVTFRLIFLNSPHKQILKSTVRAKKSVSLHFCRISLTLVRMVANNSLWSSRVRSVMHATFTSHGSKLVLRLPGKRRTPWSLAFLQFFYFVVMILGSWPFQCVARVSTAFLLQRSRLLHVLWASSLMAAGLGFRRLRLGMERKASFRR
mmetsp:Transcript_15727/g.30389  ORF Transcript_15727/g.30389 Transcript_15727/m.30389 type:complete len:206 (+) Transcript_15727:930-1547(+)